MSDKKDQPEQSEGQVSEVTTFEGGTATDPIYPDQATAGYPDSESGGPDEGTAGPNARPRDDTPGLKDLPKDR